MDTKIKLIYDDGTEEIHKVIKNSWFETALEAKKETGKRVIRVIPE